MPFQTVNVLPVLPKPQHGSGVRNGPALSSAEDKEMKKKLRNRESALAARERKKQKMLELERRVSELGRENNELKVENCALRGTLSNVMQKYGAPPKEIEDTLKTTQTLTVKKEPHDMKNKTVGRKNTVARLSQKVISLGPNERKPRDVNHPVQVKQEAPEITLTETTHDVDDAQSPSPIILPKISTVQRPKTNLSNTKRPAKVILTSNIMFSPKKANTIYTHSNHILQSNYDDQSTEVQQMNQCQDDHHVNALDMLELPVVKQEPQDYHSKIEVISESPVQCTMGDSPMETPSPSSSESLVSQPVSPLWCASGSPSSDSAYSTGSEAGVPSNTIQLSPLRSQSHEALSCTIRVPHVRMEQKSNIYTQHHSPDHNMIRPKAIKRTYPKEHTNTMWYQPAERLQRLDPPYTTRHHDDNFVEHNKTENRVPVIHHENEQWSNVLHNDIHMTGNLTSSNRTDPQEYLNTPTQVFNNPQLNHHHQVPSHMADSRSHSSPVEMDFNPPSGITRSNDFDGLADRSLFQSSMLNIDEVLFGLS